jgi:hypothetical protein
VSELLVDKIITPECDCRCGGRFFVATVKDQVGPRVFHKNPACPQVQRMLGVDFLEWVRTGKDSAAPPKPNRKARRRMERAKRLAQTKVA